MVTYLDADTAPLRNTGQIRLYGEEGFAGERVGFVDARAAAMGEQKAPPAASRHGDAVGPGMEQERTGRGGARRHAGAGRRPRPGTEPGAMR